jgi:hypothetical protein
MWFVVYGQNGLNAVHWRLDRFRTICNPGAFVMTRQKALRGCEKIGTGTFATTDFPRFSGFSLGASPIFSKIGTGTFANADFAGFALFRLGASPIFSKIGTGTFANVDFPGCALFRLGASPIFSQPLWASPSQLEY